MAEPWTEVQVKARECLLAKRPVLLRINRLVKGKINQKTLAGYFVTWYLKRTCLLSPVYDEWRHCLDVGGLLACRSTDESANLACRDSCRSTNLPGKVCCIVRSAETTLANLATWWREWKARPENDKNCLCIVTATSQTCTWQSITKIAQTLRIVPLDLTRKTLLRAKRRKEPTLVPRMFRAPSSKPKKPTKRLRQATSAAVKFRVPVMAFPGSDNLGQ